MRHRREPADRRRDKVRSGFRRDAAHSSGTSRSPSPYEAVENLGGGGTITGVPKYYPDGMKLSCSRWPATKLDLAREPETCQSLGALSSPPLAILARRLAN